MTDEITKEEMEIAPPLVTKEPNETIMAQSEEKPKPILGKPSTVKIQAGAKGMPKKGLTGETKKEYQKQMKQMKDERKATIDNRYTYIFQAITDASDMDYATVEDSILADEKWSMFDDFFAQNGAKKLMFYFQEMMVDEYSRFDAMSVGPVNPLKKLFIATGSAEPLKGLCFFFIRTTDKAITINNIAAEVTFQMLDASGGRLLNALERYISKVMFPILRNLDEWGSMSTKDGYNSKISDFFEILDRFLNALTNAQKNMDGQMQLDEDDDKELMEKIENPNYRHVAVNSSETMEKLETLLGRWIKQIEQVLSESEQIRREADDVGPSAELIYWKSRMARFNNLLEQMKTKKVIDVRTILHFAKSRSLKKWHELDARITDAANEAKDNVKFLYTLDKFFGPLTKCDPVGMLEHIPSLVNAIRMIHSISQYYNSSERMTSLFVKVTNQMITTCKHYMYEGVTKIWEHSRQELIKRINNCKTLNEEYQNCFHRTKKKLQEDPSEKQFEFSENYIFGKFDAFCKRLEKISRLQCILESYSILQTFKIEGIDSIVVKYKSINEIIKKKTYDILDHRKSEFDNDFEDFTIQFDSLETQIHIFLDAWFQKAMPIEKQLAFLKKFEQIDCLKLDCQDKHLKILHNYSKTLENVRKLYQKHKADPPIVRNLPPISGKISWSRHLFKKIEEPMMLFKEIRPEILKSSEAIKLIKNYNKMAAVLLEFEILYYKNWFSTVETFKTGLGSSLLIKNKNLEKEGQKFLVNFDPNIMELIQESKYIRSLELEIPEIASRLIFNENTIKDTYRGIKEILIEYEEIIESIPPLLFLMMKPYIQRVDDAISPGLISLTWASINVQEYMNNLRNVLKNFRLLIKKVSDILEVRIEGVLDDMSITALCDLPEDEPVIIQEFLTLTEQTVTEAVDYLARQSKLVEVAVNDIIEMLKANLTEAERKNLSAEEGYECLTPDPKKPRCTECQPCAYYTMLNNFTQRNTETLIKCTRLTLDAIKRRLQISVNKFGSDSMNNDKRSALFKADLVLYIPNILTKPNLDEIQMTLNKVVQVILRMSENIEPWSHMFLHHKQLQELEKLNDDATEDVKAQGPGSVKSLNKLVADHKDVAKVVSQLSGIMNTFKVEVQELLTLFSIYGSLWKEEPQTKVKEFMETKPILSEIHAQIKHFSDMEAQIHSLPSSYRVGAVEFHTEPLKEGLISECKNWKNAYAQELNKKSAQEMDSTLELFDNLTKRLSRPVKDLDDVRSHMAALSELREAEIKVDMTIQPIEEAYVMLNKYEIYFNDGNAERVDSLTYGYSKLRSQAQEVQEHLLQIQPHFKSNLINGVEAFKENVTVFVGDYDSRGPMETGIAPREASDRLTIFQSKFDELWRKYTTYSGGEELFGLEVTDYPDLQRIKKELNLLQKLYQLYNSVLDTVNGYYDVAWSEINIDSINQQLLDFQNKCRKLPKALKEWQAYDDLRKTIDDFNETCPLLEMMAHNAMMTRHWERIETVTGHKFDVESDNFLLRNLMEAPLLQNKEEIEDICISAVKEKDIEAKLKVVISDWSAQQFSFSVFKNRGELLLKGDATGEIVALMEDSLMALGALLSNRYNAPFKPKIQEWVQKLTGATETIENWLQVQNLWIYLEAVFVGGDIAKQLPQEAKRFGNIDKSWQKIMQRAHEIPNVINCCMGDDTLSQLLPHLLEQLELCQKSLTGYLEKKRLVFPRFFFVSDPALLEILGQASDSHTIQAHLLSVFDNTKSVTFDEKIYDKILAVNSQENESVPLDEAIMAQGNVEIWLGDLMRMSMKSLHSVIRSASITINDTQFKLMDFENSYASQVGLLGLQMIWTRDSEEALSLAKTDKKAMTITNQKFLDILNELIAMTTQNLTKIERTKFETLITIHVHQRDIFDDLVNMHIRSPKDFEWLKQSRFYFKEDSDQCIVSITDVDFIYQNEFLGCTDRLVITPLTDRCYITLSQALGMSLGGAPAGPAGTGKTETTKDMGRCLGKFVVVFNCSDQMDYRGLGRIYKGLAQSGSWGCFDEFNRIELPVLSVAAQQISIVLTCKKERKTQFIFTDGDVVEMDPEFGIFLTMNPGYAGRQELPENLKINFRTVAMMVPDRAIIIRVKLASCGFLQNTMLSKKFYTLYKLCEEQLSKQVHYDFGLRNILSVLRTLGAFKRENPEDSEPLIVMRVLRDMNLSKLVDEDEALFLSLIEDLFPEMKVGIKSYPDMEAAINKQIDDQKLINHDPWRLKLIQLYETQRVRHGMMTLGPSGAGKTRCINVLMKSLTDCGEPHKEMRMNPKAITAPQMFGRLDVATNDWTDGIFSTLWRRTHKVKKGEHVWLILDGPVDAIWIENLNSVLDDNKTLTLANGDRIPMAPNTKIIFEVHNIDNASPATVSRNGMVYMSSSILDWQPILKSWLLKYSDSFSSLIFNTFNLIFTEAYRYVTRTLLPKMVTLECNYIRQAIDLLEGFLGSMEEKDIKQNHLDKLIVFSIMWSLGALLELEDRLKLQMFISDKKCLPLPNIKDEDTIFEYVVNDKGEWEHWTQRVPEYLYPTDHVPEYISILVPNVDNTRTDFLIETIVKQSKAVMLIGEQGSAKTVIIKGYLNKYNPEDHIFKSLNFSSATTPNMFQRTVESYVDKRMGTTFGPPAGKKMSIFIDDINMPVINEWGDQITNEIVRQMMEMNGFYSLDKPGDFTNIIDIQLLAAMIHPGGGRNDIPQRLKRHYSIFNCTLPSNASIDKIFRILGCGYFCIDRGFNGEVKETVDSLVVATRKLWQKTKIKMLPTPAKFHYVFNLRDLSRIWQGMLITTSEVITSGGKLMSLWKHECMRVITDRFTEQIDKDWFEKTLRQTGEEECGFEVASQMSEEPYFVDFLRDAPEATGEETEDADLEAPKVYEYITSFEQLSDRLNVCMTQYNESVRGGKLDLVFFKDAMTHLVKISRVIRTTKGHALLVGVGGSGKQSLTRLASYIAGYETFQITLTRSYNITNLMEDLKHLYRTSGQQGKGITFLFTDNEIKDESFLEFLNNMLSSGEIANLFARDEMDEILQELVGVMKKEHPRRPPTNENLQEYYMSRVLKYLHVVLCFSPVGEKFRNRSLRFPGLISGCTIDWFQRWPKDALVAVSNYFLSTFDIVCTPEVKKAVVNTMGTFQDLVAESCNNYFQRYRRLTHVTPKSYLSFIAGYKEVYINKKEEIGMLATRMNTGLKKLVEATESVNELSKQLEVKEKELAVASKKAEEVLAQVTIKATAAQKVKEQVQVVKDRAELLVNSISRDKAIAEEKLKAAEPALKEAEEALETIKPSHISTVKKLGRPPHLIMRIMDCVLILYRKKLDQVTADPERPCPKPSWAEAGKLMSGSNFLSSLLSFPKDTINDEVVDLMEPYFAMEDFNLASAKNVCGDVAGLCSWTKAMSSFFSINKEVLPLKANLAVQEKKLESAMQELNDAQMTLDEKQAELDLVQADYDKAMSEKQTLVDDAESCRRKMSNAKALIGGLAGERERWTEASKTFELQIKKLVGDVLIVTAFLSYCGPFNQDFRNLLQRNWKNELITNGIPFTSDMNAVSMLTDNATVSEWNVQGLPNDELSIQNGLIVTRAPRYPLLIDPQGQGKAWLQSKEKNNELQITALNHKYFRNHLEDSLSLGRPLIIEDIGEEIDPALDNVLEKNFIKSGRSFKVKVGDKEVDVMNGFQLYVTTKLPNPSYTPEVFAKTSIIDFTVTMKGLEDQLLGIVILKEKQELEAERTKLMEEVAENKRKTKELEDNLLYRLTSTQGSLVEDESLIEVLRVTKETAEDVKQKLLISKDTEIKINNAREEYRPVATRGSILYFLIVEMSMVNLMYQTALRQFLGLFDRSMEKSVKSPITTKRINNIIEYLTYEVFQYTARGFYECDKFTFTVLLTMKIALQSGQVKHEEFQIFIKGGAALDLNAVEPKPKKWIQDLTWLNLVELSKLPCFAQITDQVTKNDKAWKNWFDEDAPEEAIIPDGYSSLDTFKRLLLIRSWCPDRTVPMAKKYISETMGVRYAEGIITNLEEMCEETTKTTPMICFLSMGSDPTDNIERLAKKKNLKCGAISMGQGQEVHARKLMSVSMQEGRWMLLQNCHLGINFMDEFLEIIKTAENVHENFCSWVTTEGHPKFPINLLQSGIKFTYDPPLGIRAGLRRTYALLSQDQLDISNLPQWKPMLYCVAFLHTTVQERRKFGPIGWNIPYEFNQSDFTATVQFIQNHLDDMDLKKGVSWPTVRYMIGEVQYGGRVTDDYDKRLLNTYAKQWFSEKMFVDTFSFFKGYPIPKGKSLDDYKVFIDKLPLVDSPECFGLHPNADITYETSNANQMLTTIVNIQPKDTAGGGGETRESVVFKLADDMLQKLPEDYNPFEVKERLSKLGTLKPLNIFLKQEVDRMQKVITIVRTTLLDLKLAIEGTIIMSENLKDALDNIFDARIPNFWKKISWESATLGFWFTDLLDRNDQFRVWLFEGKPLCFWMTGFFNPQGFLTAMRQEITRNHKGWALDAVILSNEVTKMMKEDVTNQPNEGVYVHGLLLDGAGWDRRQAKLIDPSPKVLYTALPVVHIYAISLTTVDKNKGASSYECPVYKKPRRTDLNYIFPLNLKTTKDPDYWTLRGVALLCDIK